MGNQEISSHTLSRDKNIFLFLEDIQQLSKGFKIWSNCSLQNVHKKCECFVNSYKTEVAMSVISLTSLREKVRFMALAWSRSSYGQKEKGAL
jgi:hypothetical protein